jgi:hypothetical protein
MTGTEKIRQRRRMARRIRQTIALRRAQRIVQPAVADDAVAPADA